MKKRRILITVFVAILLVSCVVKSLKPFYTEETLAYDGTLLGKWEDTKLRVWEIVPMMKFLDSTFIEKEMDLDDKVLKGKKLNNITKEIKEGNATVKVDEFVNLGGNQNNLDSIRVNGKVTISKNKDFFENKELQRIYKNAYLFIKKTEEEKDEEAYIVVPFKIKGQIFLDFTPFEVKFGSDLAEMHLVGIHTFAKLDTKGDTVELRWLSELVLEELFEQKKIRISHEKIGIDKKDILLTASSEELQKFIAKYMGSEGGKDWGSSDLTLTRIK